MIPFKTIAALIVIAILSTASRAAPATTSVTILAVTPFGELLRPVKVIKFAAGDVRGRDYSSQFTDGKAHGIPYGPYFAQVSAGGRGIAGFVRVGRENTLLVLSGPDKFIERGPGLPGLTGKVTGVGDIKPVWVRLVRLYSEDLCCTIVALSDDGTFSFGGLDAADYVLLVLSDNRVLFEGRVRIDETDSLISVDLAKGQATVQPQ